jgi:hypothetical protein
MHDRIEISNRTDPDRGCRANNLADTKRAVISGLEYCTIGQACRLTANGNLSSITAPLERYPTIHDQDVRRYRSIKAKREICKSAPGPVRVRARLMHFTLQSWQFFFVVLAGWISRQDLHAQASKAAIGIASEDASLPGVSQRDSNSVDLEPQS